MLRHVSKQHHYWRTHDTDIRHYYNIQTTTTDATTTCCSSRWNKVDVECSWWRNVEMCEQAASLLTHSRYWQSDTRHYYNTYRQLLQMQLLHIQRESKNTALRFSDVFSQTIVNFWSKFYVPIYARVQIFIQLPVTKVADNWIEIRSVA